MALSWNEIKDRAQKFSKEWENTTNEEADAKPFLIDFFNIFGIIQKKVASFEHRVKKLDEHDGYIDMLWKGTLLVEMKSRGKNLDKANLQALDYLLGLKQYELPKYILICDFNTFRLYDLEAETLVEFLLPELVANVQHFGFIAGYQKCEYKEQDIVNVKAAALMGKLHDKLKAVGYDGHPLELYLVRLLFILFADDTTIFDKDIFIDFIEQKTVEDGSDLAARLSELFYILNTPSEKRLKNIDEHMNRFPYVNGKLFEETLPPAAFDTEMRKIIVECCYLDWGKISPAIFGSMFQSVMNPVERRNLGAHYTSEKNILKLIKPLFLDDLWNEFETVKGNRNRLVEFHGKLSKLKFLDPACGCGNFLVITYRELRLLEIEILRELNKTGQRFLNVAEIIWLDVDMMYGIEYEEFPARIAEVAMWLIDHQMNMIVSQEFGQYFTRLPLKKAANISHGNALDMEWGEILANEPVAFQANDTVVTLNEPEISYKTVHISTQILTIIDNRTSTDREQSQKTNFDYIFGNPPFIGKSLQNATQKKDMERVFAGAKGTGVLDYVTAWYIKAARLIQNTRTKVAFVSTNSISQGEQVGVLWNILFNYYNVKIHFAHRTFKWGNEAKGNAAVHVVIIGFANFDTKNKAIFEYDNIKGEPHEIKVENINPYLVEGEEIILFKRTKPICDAPQMNYGSMPNDGGNLLLNESEKDEFIFNEPGSAKYIRKFVMGEELINSIPRYCLWLVDIQPNELKMFKEIVKRVEKVYKSRISSKREATRKLAPFPSRFGEVRQPDTDYIALPRVSSENRNFIPIAILNKEVIAGDKVYTISSNSLYDFGILTSTMHMSWMRVTSGRLKSDYSYSNQLTYNNFPWPENPPKKQIDAIEAAAQAVLDARSKFPNSSLAVLYDPLTMPPELVKAHQTLDRSVDLAYRPQAFASEAKRMEFLFSLYAKYTSGIFNIKNSKKRR